MSIGISVGILVIPFFATHLILSFGWRSSFLILGAIAAVIMIGSTFLIRENPGQIPPSPLGNHPSPSSPSSDSWTLAQALATGTFWMFFAGYLLWCTGFYMVSIHLPAYGMDLGLSPYAAAIAVSLVGGGSIFGKVIMGLLSDRIGPQKVVAANILLQAACIIGVLFSRRAASLYLFSALFGFGYGGTGPQLPVVAARFFGVASVGAIFGFLILSGQIGGAIGPLLAGKMFDLRGSYFPGFLAGAVCVAAGFALMALLRPPRPEKNSREACFKSAEPR